MQLDGIAILVLLLGPAAAGLVMAMTMPMAHAAPAGLGVTIATLYGFGFVLFTVAKTATIPHDGMLDPFGSGPMSPAQRQLYRLGYAMMATALFLTLMYIKVTR
jgi:hypothetical protein